MRATRAGSGAPPQASMTAGRPGRIRTASSERKSARISIVRGSPIVSSGAPAETTDSLSCHTRNTRPAAGARMARVLWCVARVAASTSSVLRACASSAAAASTDAIAVRARASAASRAISATSFASANSRIRCDSRVANSAASSAARWRAAAASTAARDSATRRTSSGAATPCAIDASRSFSLTVSPGSTSMRNTRPVAGAAIT